MCILHSMSWNLTSGLQCYRCSHPCMFYCFLGSQGAISSYTTNNNSAHNNGHTTFNSAANRRCLYKTVKIVCANYLFILLYKVVFFLSVTEALTNCLTDNVLLYSETYYIFKERFLTILGEGIFPLLQFFFLF